MTSEVARIGTQKRRRRSDEVLIAKLAAGATRADAARAAGVSLRTCARRCADPAFRQQVDEARSSILDRVLDQLGVGSLEAVEALRDVVATPDQPGATVRVSAARALLQSLLPYRDQVELAERVDLLERQAQRRGLRGV